MMAKMFKDMTVKSKVILSPILAMSPSSMAWGVGIPKEARPAR